MTNKITSFYTTGWRPFSGWVCAVGLSFQYIFAPFFTWLTMLCGHPIPFPVVESETLNTLLFALLGLSGLRTTEKIKGGKNE